MVMILQYPKMKMTKPLPPRIKIQKRKLKLTPYLPKDMNCSCRTILGLLAIPSETVMIPAALTFTRTIKQTTLITYITVIIPIPTMMVIWSYSPSKTILTSQGFDKVTKTISRNTKHLCYAMIQEWGKFRFARGVVEAQVTLPRIHDVGCLWP